MAYTFDNPLIKEERLSTGAELNDYQHNSGLSERSARCSQHVLRHKWRLLVGVTILILLVLTFANLAYTRSLAKRVEREEGKDTRPCHGNIPEHEKSKASFAKLIITPEADVSTADITAEETDDTTAPGVTQNSKKYALAYEYEAFSAQVSEETSQTVTYDRGDLVVFNTVEYQTKSASYDASTSTYTCPTDGVYLFQVQLFAAQDDRHPYLEMGIYKNDKEMSMFSTRSGEHQSMNGHAMFMCSEGDTVQVRNVQPGKIYFYKGLDNKFSGFRLMKL